MAATETLYRLLPRQFGGKDAWTSTIRLPRLAETGFLSYERVMQLSNSDAERLIREGVEALRQGRARDARVRFQQVTETGRANAQIWLLQATACRAEGDRAAEEGAVDSLLALEPRMVRAHIMKGDCRSSAGDVRGALSFYESALLISDGQQVPGDLAGELARAEAAVTEMKAGFERKREAALAAQGLPPEHRSARFQQSLDILSGRKRIFVQEPTGYYFPCLPQIQFFDTADFAWVPEVEAAASAIREELQALLRGGMEGFRPYLKSESDRPRVDSNPLLDSIDWSALFLCENGTRFEDAIGRCPRTWQAAQAAPLPHMTGSPTVMFSLLRPGARIAAHTGMHNTRLICHLPLIVPPGCGFRVGNEVRQWEEGKLLIFDDTIEHEAWNEGGEDRVVLIFDIWRPELTEQERREVAIFFNGSTAE